MTALIPTVYTMMLNSASPHDISDKPRYFYSHHYAPTDRID